MELREKERVLTQEKVTAQDEATSELRWESYQTKAEIHDLWKQMQPMLTAFQHAFPSSQSPLSENKRSADNTSNNNLQSKKRQDVRASSGKKLFPDEMDLEDPSSSQQKLTTDEPEKSMK